jgi:hypothetical protein
LRVLGHCLALRRRRDRRQIARMRKNTPQAQLALIDLPPSRKRPGVRARPPMSPAVTARHCNALLAELDRIALAERARATHLAELFQAVERAHESHSPEAVKSAG